jgi:hypothetical protein
MTVTRTFRVSLLEGTLFITGPAVVDLVKMDARTGEITERTTTTRAALNRAPYDAIVSIDDEVQYLRLTGGPFAGWLAVNPLPAIVAEAAAEA